MSSMPLPQFAPDYRDDRDPTSASSSSCDSEEESEEHLEPSSSEGQIPALEQIPTAKDVRPAQPAYTRTKSARSARSSRNQPPPVPVGFWHWEMNGVRLHVLALWAKTNFILCAAILIFLCIYWGALFDQDKRTSALGVWIVDFDGQIAPYADQSPEVGPFIVGAIQQFAKTPGSHPGYHVRSAAEFQNDPYRVRESVYDFEAWAAIIINANATGLLRAAVERGNKTYDPNGACQIILNTARDSVTTQSYILPSLTGLQTSVKTTFAQTWVPSVLSNSSIPSTTLQNVPQALSPAIDFTTIDLRPFGPPVATPAISVGLIYLILLSFFSFTFFLPIHMKYLNPKGHPPLHFYQLIIWRYIATVSSYFILSLVYSLVSLMFLMPFSNSPGSHVETVRNPDAYGRATFFVYWMLNWVAMTAFGIACENMAMFLGTPWAALWLPFWVITNVSTGFYSVVVENRFYRWGYAWPMHNLVEATRSLLFDLHPRIGLNFGILFAWCAVNTAIFPLACYYMRWATMRVKRKKEEKERKWEEKMRKEKEDPSLFTRVTTQRSRPA